MKVSANLQILIVEDSVDERMLEKTLLNKQGFKNIKTVDNGKIALEVIDSENYMPELIIADWDMPELDGIDFLDELQNRNLSIPFLLITGHNDREHVVTASKHGVRHYLIKPFSAADLISKVIATLKD